MTTLATVGAYAAVTEPATLKLERILPGPVERVWSYLTQSDLRREWMASGDMDLHVGAPFELVWHNDTISDLAGKRPEGINAEHRMESRIIAADPPRKLVFTWRAGEVSFELTPKGHDVLLTLIHRRISDRTNMVMIGAGWHTHLDLLGARLSARKFEHFWERWSRLRKEYETRIPAQA